MPEQQRASLLFTAGFVFNAPMKARGHISGKDFSRAGRASQGAFPFRCFSGLLFRDARPRAVDGAVVARERGEAWRGLIALRDETNSARSAAPHLPLRPGARAVEGGAGRRVGIEVFERAVGDGGERDIGGPRAGH